MLDVKKLERRWLKYKVRTYFPLIAGFIVLISIAGTSLILLSSDPKPSVKSDIAPKSSNASVQKASTEATSPVVEENTTWIEPSMNFVNTFTVEPASSIQPSTPVNTKVYNKGVSPSAVPSSPYVQEVPSNPIQPIQKSIKNESPMAINRNETKLEIEALERRFKENSNSNLGVFIAKYYYDHGNYNESLNYALKTNEINNNLEDSWIIFAKSLAKLGKTDQAKKTLKIYLDQSNSESAKNLLNSLEQGGFK